MAPAGDVPDTGRRPEGEMDLKPLLSSRDDGAPSGENLEYDPDFIMLELAAQPGEEKQAGNEILAAEDPDWADVKEKSLGVLERAHDIRAALYLGEAALYTDGLPGFAEVTGYVRALLTDHWATCHPQLDADDDNDPTMRINAVQNLAGADRILRGLRRTPLSESRGFGRAALRDVLSASGEAPAEGTMDSGQISASFQDTDPAVLTARLEAARKAVQDVAAIEGAFAEHTPGQGPVLEELTRLLKQIARTLADHAPGAESAGDEAGGEAEAADAGGPAPAASGGGGGGGAVNSHRDVHAALDRIMAFYQRAEPSSPVPILLMRAKKLVGADFMTIMNDMAPRGLENVRLIGGMEDE